MTWISVKERLPEGNTGVLIWAVGNEIAKGWWWHENGWQVPDWYTTQDITHWQSLPNPPEMK